MIERYSEERSPRPARNDLNRDVHTRTPLLDQDNTRWYGEKLAHDGPDSRRFQENTAHRCAFMRCHCSRRSWRMLMIAVLLVTIGFWAWTRFLSPQMQEEWEMEEGCTNQLSDEVDIAKHKQHFQGTWLQDIDGEHVPGSEQDLEGMRRLVFVGDIHGCLDDLKKLLKEVRFNEDLDHLVTVGDVISKGPDSAGVLDELMRLRASGVRGNHEDRILTMALSTTDDTSDVEIESKKSKSDKKLLKHLSRKHINYLQSMPLILRIRALPMAATPTHKSSSPIAEDILVVHAGLVPAVALEKQKPYFVMNMRSIKTKNHLPLAEAARKKDKSKPWHDIWGWYNDRLFRKKSVKDFDVYESFEDAAPEESDSWLGRLGLVKSKKWPKPQVVVYGHHSKEGLQLHRWSKGIDTGCVRGGRLTAMILDARGGWTTNHVNCKDHR